MTLGFEAIVQGHEDEDLVAAWFMRRGWSPVLFGQRLWDPATCSLGKAQVINVIRQSEGPLRHAPDMLVAKDGWPERLVEVFRNNYDNGRVALELAKLNALDRWADQADVFLVDVAHQVAWQHVPGRWSQHAVTDVSRAGRGSGDPYVILDRDQELPFTSVFP